jgi:beta propeller repeat protein
LDVLNNTCATHNYSCYKLVAPSVITDTSKAYYNLSFRAKSNVTGKPVIAAITSADLENYNVTFNLTTSWATYWFNYTFDATGGAANISFHLNSTTTGSNFTIYLDDIIVKTNRSKKMDYNSYDDVYEYETGVNDFREASAFYRYNISCAADIFEPMNLSELFTVNEDTTKPIKPILYPQINIHPDNITENSTTFVAGYFNESDINYNIMILHGTFTYEFSGTSGSSEGYSEFKDDAFIVNFDAASAENVTFAAWSEDFEEAVKYFKYAEFSNHNRSYFDRYEIYRANRTGDDLRLEFYDPLEKVVPAGTRIRLYTTEHPPGYFIKEVSLYNGANRITVWSSDLSGNSGNASTDWINAPYSEAAPAAPELWPLPDAIKFNTNLSVFGFVNDSQPSTLNMTINIIQGDYFNYTWNTGFASSTQYKTASLTSARPADSDFFYISDAKYDEIRASYTWADLWVDFSNHNLSLWKRYDVTSALKNPGEDPRVYISPNLTSSVSAGTIATFHNHSFKQGFFNISVNTTTYLKNGSNTIYALALRNSTEGNASASRSIFVDNALPAFAISLIPNYSYSTTPTFTFNVTDNYKVNISSLIVNVSNSNGWNNSYTFNSSAVSLSSAVKNISCSDYFGNGSVYNCSFTLNVTANGTYTVNFSVYDVANWFFNLSHSMDIVVSAVDISSVLDEDDITNDAWLYFNWTPGAGAVSEYEFALGNTTYPNHGYNSSKNWTSMCNATSSCTRAWINLTHDSNASDVNRSEVKMKTGTIYYLTVRAKSPTNEYGTPASSNGIMFIDQTPPNVSSINDHGPWSNSNSQLSAVWVFTDSESDVIEYQYAIGTAAYPDPNYRSISGPTTTTSTSVVNSGLSLTENATYYYNVRARNGNSALNYSGSWSSWQTSSGTRVDTVAPAGGFIRWQNYSFTNVDFVTINYDVGVDSGSANVRGLIEIGRGVLSGGICPSISDFDFYNASDVLTARNAYKDVNVTSGYCYVFRLFVWDNASNSNNYRADNETLKVVKADTSPPSDIAPVVDDGFFTNSRTSLHANWADSSDAESGFSHYQWRIVREPVGVDICDVNTTHPVGTNCSEVSAGNTTVSEVSVTGLTLVHNYKYYFEVIAYNKANSNSSKRYSDGIIYLDNSAPGDVTLISVNNVTVASSPYYTQIQTPVINITAIGDLDGYNDIANCVLLNASIDYTESSQYAVNCTETANYNFNSTYTNVTYIQCSKNTTFNGTALQGTWSWYLSCRDYYENSNDFNGNILTEFTVDWPEAPVFNASSLTDITGSSAVYSDDDLYCSVQISDPDTLKNINTTVTFDWLRGSTVLKSKTATVTNNSNNTYSASDSLTANFTYRSNNITCRVNASDNTSIWRNHSLSLIINNTPPSSLILVSPDSETANAMMNFSWSGPSDDVDSDFMTLKVQSDNETNFNISNNPGIAFGAITKLTVEGLAIPGTQRNADVYGTKIVYEDDRAGNWDIYLYDTLTDTETAVATSTSHQYNPQIYGNYIVYEQNNSGTFAVYLYNISNAQTTAVVSGINYTSMDYFGDYIVYNDGSGVRLRAINNLTGEVSIFTAPTAANLSVYGKNIVWTNSSDKSVWLYDYSNLSAYKRPQFGPAELFGYFLVSENNSVINVTNLQNGTSINLSGFNASIYGNKLVYCNASGGITITDLLTAERFNVSLDIGNNPAIYDKLVVYENSSDLWYAAQTVYLRSSFIVEKSGSNYYEVNTSVSDDDGYVWRIEGCDNSFIANSCVWSQTVLGASYALFTVDNTAPVFSSVSPAAESVVAGQFRVYSTITDNLGADYVSSANYSISYRSNGTVRFSGSLTKSGSTWSSSTLNFLDHSTANFTLKLYAVDSMSNINSTSVNFSINNATSWFAFGSGSDEILDNVTVINGSINSDFVAYTVLTSTLRIIGPSPASTVRFISSQNNLSVTNHNYSDPVSVLTWPDGSYRVDFSGTNLDGNNTANRTFFVDNNYPRWYDNTTSPNGTIYASNALVLSINWSDSTLREVNITYNNTNISNVSNEATLTETQNGTISSGIFTSSSLNISSYINRTFYWWSSARDALNRTNSTNNTIYWSVFVNSNPPTRTADLANMSIAEDSTNSSPFDLSNYFSDINDGGVWGYLDNITYAIVHNCSTNLSFTYNTTTGAVYNVTSAGNYTGHCGVNTTATDSYGKLNTSNFTLYVYPQNDAPSIRNSSGAIIPAQSVAEDSASPIQLDLSLYEYDIDGDSVTWQTPTSWNTSLINVSYNSVTKMVNLTPQSNKFGVVNVTFTLQDNASTPLTAKQNVTVTVTSQADPPTQPNITNPLAGVNESDPIIITWDASTDADGDSLNYSLFYTTNGGNSWNRIVNLVGASTTIYYWNSSSNFSSDQANVTLRVNVTDGTNVNSTTTTGNFSVDNKAPQITVVSPAVAYLVISSGVGIVNVTTQENASCSFSSNVSGISSSVTSNGTFHNASLSTLVVNVSYRINASCTDAISNTNWTTVDFAAKSAALEVISVTASPSAAISSNVVNLTLQIFSLTPWHFINVTVNNSNGISNYLSISNFTSQINSSNSYTYTNSSLNVSSTGRHDVTIVKLNNTDGATLTSLFYANVFEVFPQVNQTLNII